MEYVPVTFGDLYACALQTQYDLSEGAETDTAADLLREAMINFSLMYRGNPCECGSNPCIAVMPKDLIFRMAQERAEHQ